MTSCESEVTWHATAKDIIQAQLQMPMGKKQITAHPVVCFLFSWLYGEENMTLQLTRISDGRQWVVTALSIELVSSTTGKHKRPACAKAIVSVICVITFRSAGS